MKNWKLAKAQELFDWSCKYMKWNNHPTNGRYEWPGLIGKIAHRVHDYILYNMDDIIPF